MELVRNVQEADYGFEGEVFFRLYDRYIRLYMSDPIPMDYIQKCVEYLNSLSDEVIHSWASASIRYCDTFSEWVGKPTRTFDNPHDVFELIEPKTLIIDQPNNPNEPIVHLSCDCDWEIEHGLELIVRNDKVLYVGANNGMNPWADFSEPSEWNYA